MKLLIALSCLLFSSCALLRGAIQESKTNALLFNYMKEVRYSLSKEEILRHVGDDIRASERWHREHDPIIQANAALGGGIYPRHTESDDGKVIEVEGVREKYRIRDLGSEISVAILNSADEARLCHKELELLTRIDPERAAKLKARILAEHPDIVLDPWAI